MVSSRLRLCFAFSREIRLIFFIETSTKSVPVCVNRWWMVNKPANVMHQINRSMTAATRIPSRLSRVSRLHFKQFGQSEKNIPVCISHQAHKPFIQWLPLLRHHQWLKCILQLLLVKTKNALRWRWIAAAICDRPTSCAIKHSFTFYGVFFFSMYSVP